jgi:hypothetical protein
MAAAVEELGTLWPCSSTPGRMAAGTSAFAVALDSAGIAAGVVVSD